MKSKLAAQLKALEVIDCSNYNLEFLLHLAHPMPNLRKLILGAVCAIETMVPYRKILSYVTKIEKLAFYPPDTELDKALDVLQLLPDLRVLGLDYGQS
ncbi:hypothetical protein FRC07_006258 [Ceratobasidium sp. 392]|nr:hypothetical protein FRC07_006258 [Ceratobasidium sp. 392]